VLKLLCLSELKRQGLGCCLVTTTFRINSESSHLIFDLSEDLVRRCGSLNSYILHVTELFSKISLDRLNEEVQIRDIAANLFITTVGRDCVDAALGVTTGPLLHLFALLAHAFLEGLLLALIICRGAHPSCLRAISALRRRRQSRVLAATTPLRLVRHR